MAQLIDGKAIAAAIRAETAAESAAFRSAGVTPRLAVVLVGDDPASGQYVRNKEKACAEAGIVSETVRLPQSTDTAGLLDTIRRLNADPMVHGLLVQVPLPKQIDEAAVLLAVSPEKDVDCFHPLNVGRLISGFDADSFVPCTPAGIVEMLMRSGNPPAGKRVVIVGRSAIVGKPLALLLMGKGPSADATVTVCHTRTPDLAVFTRAADILVAAAGRPEMIRGDMVRPGAVVIDVGTNRVSDPTGAKPFRWVGDVCFEEVAPKASHISPVPGGVGPMTIAMLLKNTLTACRRSERSRKT
ncbi:MAG: bifunctional methylenetetrahydrofolate dehydrogenase/methenyltetrahydrofolate cyclohydrolase FolD [bacterium]|nr:bifunctional methylenetetrahydrofolate dehydrogenase/methenyltetrahydrofolate cyclohydrolase FolD [bacterium]